MKKLKSINMIDVNWNRSWKGKAITMISYDELLHTKREDILRIAAKYGASNVRVFGSVARGEADEQSDIDLLIDLTWNWNVAYLI